MHVVYHDQLQLFSLSIRMSLPTNVCNYVDNLCTVLETLVYITAEVCQA